jgi:O-antigen/teichoic acid export membrane protein
MLRGNRFLASVLVLAGGTALGQGLVALSAPILTRLYSPADHGQFALFSTFVAIFGAGGALSLDVAIVSARDEGEASYLGLGALISALFTSILGSLVLFTLINRNVFEFGSLPRGVAFLACPALLVATAFSSLRYSFVRERSYGMLGRASVLQNWMRCLFQVGLGVLHPAWNGLLIGDLFGRAIGIGWLRRQNWPVFRRGLGTIRPHKLWDAVRRNYRFPLYSVPSTVINEATLNLPLPLIAHLYGIGMAGQFALAQRVLLLPIAVVGSSVADAYHGHIAANLGQAPAARIRFFYQAARSLSLMGLCPMLLLMVLGPWVFSFAFGPAWSHAGTLATVMAPWILAQFVVSPLSRAVFVMGGQKSKLLYDLSALGAILLTLGGACLWRLSLTHFVALLSGLQVLAYGVYFLILMRLVASEPG